MILITEYCSLIIFMRQSDICSEFQLAIGNGVIKLNRIEIKVSPIDNARNHIRHGKTHVQNVSLLIHNIIITNLIEEKKMRKKIVCLPPTTNHAIHLYSVRYCILLIKMSIKMFSSSSSLSSLYQRREKEGGILTSRFNRMNTFKSKIKFYAQLILM